MSAMPRLILGTCALFVSTGCATIMDGKREPVVFSSDPSGALVIVNGTQMGVTPATIVLDREDHEYATVVFRKEGYQDQQTTLTTSLNPWFWGNFLLGIFSSFVDFATGAMWKFAPNSYHISLPPVTTSEAEMERYRHETSVRRFVLFRYDNLGADLVRGEGEDLASLLELIRMEPTARVLDSLRSEYTASTTAPGFADAVIRLLKAAHQPVLAWNLRDS